MKASLMGDLLPRHLCETFGVGFGFGFGFGLEEQLLIFRRQTQVYLYSYRGSDHEIRCKS
jgi:hypothetical protein